MPRSATERAVAVLARYDTKPHYRSSRELAEAAVRLANALHDVLYVTGDLIVPAAMATPRNPKLINGESGHHLRAAAVVHTHACAICETSLDCDVSAATCLRRQRKRAVCANCVNRGAVSGPHKVLERSR